MKQTTQTLVDLKDYASEYFQVADMDQIEIDTIISYGSHLTKTEKRELIQFLEAMN